MRVRRRRIVVAGGTGLLGRVTAKSLARHNHVEAVALSRSGNTVDEIRGFAADMLSGENLDVALAGADAVICCAHDRAAHENGARAIRNLLTACGNASVGHIVYAGIAGIETSLTSPYYAGKLAEERAIESSGLRHTILRAAQFHDLVLTVLAACDEGERYLVPHPLVLRPVAVETVAKRLADLALDGPGGRAPDLAGPQDIALADLARIFVRIKASSKPVVETGDVPARWRMLQTLTHGAAERAGPDFETWLRTRQSA